MLYNSVILALQNLSGSYGAMLMMMLTVKMPRMEDHSRLVNLVI